MAQKTVAKQTLTYLLGKCLPSSKQNAAKIRVTRNVLDTNILMYFKESEFVYAHDPQKSCKTGDTVLIQSLPEKLTRQITHKVVKVIYPLGDMVDPITGKLIVAGMYRDDVEENTELYGKLETAFDYKKAPPRGSQEDKRDFTHKKSYIKYHEDPDDPQPYAINP